MASRTRFLLLFLPLLLGADTVKSIREGLLRADALLAEEKFIEAERLYLQAAVSDLPEQKRRSFDGLLVIYQKLGRLDSVVNVGERYRTWLKERGDADRFLEVGVDVGRAYLGLGHYATGKKLLEDSLAETSLSPTKRIQALTALGQDATRRGEAKNATQRWEEVSRDALSELRSGRLKSNPKLQIEYVWSLAESYRSQKQPELAIPYLTELLAIHQRLDDYRGERETLRLLGDHSRLSKKYPEAEKSLARAIQLHEEKFSSELVLSGNLALEMAELLIESKKPEQALSFREKGVKLLREVLTNPESKREEISGALTAFSKLQNVYISSNEFGKALQLTAMKGEEWIGVGLVQPRMKFEQGSLELIAGAYREALPRLRASVQELEAHTPLNLVDYPRALNHLSLVELATGDSKLSKSAAEKTLDVYRKFSLPADGVKVDTFNLLGNSLAQQGDYPEAKKTFEEGVRLCEQIGPSVVEQRGSLLLNIALLLKAQSDLDGARRYCERAIEAFKQTEKQDSLAIIALQAALANMNAARGELDKANELAIQVLQACKEKEITRGPLVISGKHCQALYHLKRRELPQAVQLWTEVRALQEKEQNSVLLPRTLNYLAFCDELQNRLAQAEETYRVAEKLQSGNRRAFPVTNFITLWGLANVLDRQNHRKEAREHLHEALRLAEKGRLRIYGDSRQRAEYFGQFAAAFEQLVEWSIRDDDLPSAVIVAARSRGRNLLDQLEMANIDPRDALTGPDGERLRNEERELLQKIASLRAQAQLIPPASIFSEESKKLLKEYEATEDRYSEVYREILNASPLYRNFIDEEMSPATIEKIRREILGTHQAMLIYQIGRERSNVFLLGGPGGKLESFPLSVPKQLAERITVPDPITAGEILRGARGFIVKKKATEEAPLPPEPMAVERTDLRQMTARAMVDHYRLEITDETFQPSRGFVVKPKDPMKPIEPQRPDLIGNVFLPPELLKRLTELKLRHLIVVPDGPLHKLPLEAMVLRAGANPQFGLDLLPPIIYCPSTSILTRLANRPQVKTTQRTLLSLSNPAYPQVELKKDFESEAEQLLTRFGRLPLLEGSAKEAEMIAQFFPSSQRTTYSGIDATEGNFLNSVRGQNIIHIAAHGFADDRFNNLFGAIALAPPKSTKEIRSSDDGYLSLFEIYRLPLQDCELSVLSACVTNVGPLQPLEAGVTLASAFLTAGSRRVIASHWNVDDQATCDLMNTFFEGISKKNPDGSSLTFSESLQAARKKVRNNPRYRSPYFWAPFVIIGPGE
jgi:CHAT domain-containing protein/tetratricopeptide (TPR) repeat protein